MGLAVILLNWRHEERTLRCARAVTGWRALNPHLFVIDNESTNAACRALPAALPSATVICSVANVGYGGGNNLGIRQALAMELEYVLLLNTDAEIAAADVSRLLARLDHYPEIAILGPVIKEEYDEGAHRLVGGRDIVRYSSTRIAVPAGDIKKLPDYPVHEVDYVPGTVFLARSSVLKEIGLLDEQYFFSGEIADFCKRAKDRGHKICVDLEVEARHDSQQTPMRLRDTLYVYYGLRNRFLYAQKHHAREKLRYFAYWTVAGAAGFARAVWRGNMTRARAIILAVLHAYSGRYGNQNGAFSSSLIYTSPDRPVESI
jgi:GT2 family glycosyltransferase